MNQFQLKSKTGIEIPGEPEPDIYSREERKNIPSKKGTWSSSMSIPYMAHGYELRMTPIQILAFYNAIGNDGFYVPPRLGDHVMSYVSLGEEVFSDKKSVGIVGVDAIRNNHKL